jgi:hypothetical protein
MASRSASIGNALGTDSQLGCGILCQSSQWCEHQKDRSVTFTTGTSCIGEGRFAETRRPWRRTIERVRVRFYIDSTTGEPHIHSHNVKEHEVEEVLAKPTEDRVGTRAHESRWARRKRAGICASFTYPIRSLTLRS